MGLYLNQLPQTEVARLKAELAETLIANFCYPRFFDYRVGALRSRPVDRIKRQEVWQYLNAVDFNVWGRVDVDSPDFQRQVERLFIHFVQRNRSFFGAQGRKRMADVRALIASCSTALADGLRGHLRGQQSNPPFGSPRAVSSWAATSLSGRADVPWEQILASTMQLQQQLQEVRGEVRPTAAPSQPPAQTPTARPGNGSSSVPARRPRPARSLATGGPGNGNAALEGDAVAWPATGSRTGKPGDGSLVASFPAAARESEFARAEFQTSSSDAAPTLPLPLGKVESSAAAFQPAPVEVSPALPTRPRRGKAAEISPTSPFAAPPSGPLSRQASQPMTSAASASPVAALSAALQQQAPASVVQATVDLTVKPTENSAAMTSDEDVVIFEQMRHQLIIWLRVEAVRAGIELGNQNPFQLIDVLRHQDGVDLPRVQVVSTLLNMCDQVISGGRATLFDYKQAMMFYLMHTRRGQ